MTNGEWLGVRRKARWGRALLLWGKYYVYIKED